MLDTTKFSLTPALLAQFEACKTPEDLMAVAAKHNVKLTREEARDFLIRIGGKVVEVIAEILTRGPSACADFDCFVNACPYHSRMCPINFPK